jgi:hypothetical protein
MKGYVLVLLSALHGEPRVELHDFATLGRCQATAPTLPAGMLADCLPLPVTNVAPQTVRYRHRRATSHPNEPTLSPPSPP